MTVLTTLVIPFTTTNGYISCYITADIISNRYLVCGLLMM